MEHSNGSVVELSPTKSLRKTLEAALKEAEASDPDSVRTATLRLIRCAAKDRDAISRSKGECDSCPDARLLELLHVMAEQREVSARDYDDAGRISEAEREREEIAVIRSFIPQNLAGDELEAAIESVVADLEATRLKDIGRCMSALKARFPGKINVSTASKAVRQALQ